MSLTTTAAPRLLPFPASCWCSVCAYRTRLSCIPLHALAGHCRQSLAVPLLLVLIPGCCRRRCCRHPEQPWVAVRHSGNGSGDALDGGPQHVEGGQHAVHRKIGQRHFSAGHAGVHSCARKGLTGGSVRSQCLRSGYATTATTAPMGFAAMTAFRATCATVSVLAPLAAARWAAFRAVVAREYAAVAVVARAVAAL